MNWTSFVFGAIFAIATGIIANLLTPYVGPVWGRVRAWQDRGYRSRIEREIKKWQKELAEHSRLEASAKDLLVYLLHWSAGSYAAFIFSTACFFFALRGKDLTQQEQNDWFQIAFFALLIAVMLAAIVVAIGRNHTSAGAVRRRTSLEKQIAALKAKLPTS